MQIIGTMKLDRAVENFFAETEQVAFCTQNVVPGIDFTDDPLLQGRNFSYLDTQLKRLGSPLSAGAQCRRLSISRSLAVVSLLRAAGRDRAEPRPHAAGRQAVPGHPVLRCPADDLALAEV